MANQPRADNKAKAVRIPDGLWSSAETCAAARGTDRSKLINRWLTGFVNRTGLYVTVKSETLDRLEWMGDDPAEVLRTLATEALARRQNDCRARHRGPVANGACTHCGQVTG